MIALTVAGAAGLGLLTSRGLGFNVDPNDLFSKDLPFQRRIAEFEQYFPVLTNSLLILVEGEVPEHTRKAADALAGRLAALGDTFSDVYQPGEEAFFETHGLLYTSLDRLDEVADNLALLQPLIGDLARDRSVATLARVTRLGLEYLERNPSELARWESVLDHFRMATVSVYAESPLTVSWESVMLEGSGVDPVRRRVIVADPILDLERVLAAERAIETIRREASRVLAGTTGVSVRITGYPALNHEEFLGLARDTLSAGLLSFVLVVLVLAAAFRSLVVVGAAALTLVSGFVWAAGWATLSVGELNPLSIAFSVLFIGLGVDFMIHFGMHLAEALRGGAGLEEATRQAARATGPALVLCATTTAVGFLSFVPTDYRGVSDLGLISAGAMIVILLQTLTLFPALLSLWLRGAALEWLRAQRPRALPFPAPRHPRLVCAVAATLGVVALVLAPRATLETNVIELRNPESESVRAFMDLLGSETATPWYLDALAPDPDVATALATRMRDLPMVERAITLADFVPEQQEEKLEVLSDVAMLLDLHPGAGSQRADLGPDEQIAALRDLAAFLDVEAVSRNESPLGRSVRLLRDELVRFLARVDADPDSQEALAELERSLLSGFPGQLDRLRQNLEASEVTLDTLPPELVSRMVSSTGKARIQVFPTEDLGEHESMVRFVESVRALWDDITGLPVNLLDSSYATWNSLREAMLWAVLVITALIGVLWRQITETLLALAPLLLAVILTLGVTVVSPVSLNFLNVVVLPAILGIGVDSGVHMVYRAKQLPPEGRGELLGTTTAQAVFFSAVTTLASFGTLMLSAHRGVGTLGQLFAIGMAFTLLANLVVLPALIVLQQRAVRHRSVEP